MLPAYVHNFQPAVRPDFAFHAVEMIFHGLFGQRKMIGNFLVRQSAWQQRNQLLLTPRQATIAMQRRGRECLRFLFKIPE